MGILLILAQVALAALAYGAHIIHLSPWIIFMPAMFFCVIWLIAQMLGCVFAIDRIDPFVKRRR